MKCRTTFISDNYYFCMGASVFNVDHTLSVGDCQVIEALAITPVEGVFILAIDDLTLRLLILNEVSRCADLIIILDNDLNKNAHFATGNVVYASQYTTVLGVINIMRNRKLLRELRLSHREMEFLRLSNLSTAELSELFSISVKTISAHRINIQNKLSLKYKNNLALERVRQKFGIHINSYLPSTAWDTFY